MPGLTRKDIDGDLTWAPMHCQRATPYTIVALHHDDQTSCRPIYPVVPHPVTAARGLALGQRPTVYNEFR
jgi:hypothetical protein